MSVKAWLAAIGGALLAVLAFILGRRIPRPDPAAGVVPDIGNRADGVRDDISAAGRDNRAAAADVDSALDDNQSASDDNRKARDIIQRVRERGTGAPNSAG